MGFQKLRYQVLTYRSYKNFDNEKFQVNIKTCRFDKNHKNSFKETNFAVFNKYAPVEKKDIRANVAIYLKKKSCIKK